MGSDDRWDRLQQAWNAAIARRQTDERSFAGEVQVALDEWPANECGPAVDWVKARIASGEDPGRFRGVENDWLDLVLDVDDDPRADLIDTVWLEHQEVTAEQIQRLARRAPQIIELKLEEIEDYDRQLADLFPGSAPWSRLRTLTVDNCEYNKALMPGLAVTQLPALRWLAISQHWDAYHLAGASWLQTLEELRITSGSRNPEWLAPIDMPNVVQLSVDVAPADVAEMIGLLADRTRKPKLTRIVLHQLPTDFVLPSVPGFEITRASW